MTKRMRDKTPAKIPKATQKRSMLIREHDEILRAANIHLVRKHGGLMVATEIKESPTGEAKRWTISVCLRYPTGHQGYIGDLLYDGKSFSFLTPPEVRKERVRRIAADPAGIREWNEFQAATLPPGKA